jgi:hypothetical protein
MKHRLVLGFATRTLGEAATPCLKTRNAPDKTRDPGSTTFGGHRLQLRENEGEIIVERACTEFATPLT